MSTARHPDGIPRNWGERRGGKEPMTNAQRDRLRVWRAEQRCFKRKDEQSAPLTSDASNGSTTSANSRKRRLDEWLRKHGFPTNHSTTSRLGTRAHESQRQPITQPGSRSTQGSGGSQTLRGSADAQRVALQMLGRTSPTSGTSVVDLDDSIACRRWLEIKSLVLFICAR